MSWLVDRLRTASVGDRRQLTLVGLSMALFLFHCTWFSIWQIEDAAISYAFARNFANGDGLVTNVGGAWVEGFSNPTWTLLIALTTWLGFDPFPTGKLLGAGFGLLTLPLAWLWARRFQDHEDALWPALAPLALAMSTQYAQWAVAGLENALLSFLFTLGVVLLLREGDDGRIGWSGIPLGLLAFTRPEAPVYAGMAVLIGGPAAFRAGGFRWLGSFVALSAGPFFAWHAWRFAMFAWPFPNTYYAKLGESRFRPWRWDARSWTYLRGWSLSSLHIVLLPVFALGASGTRGWRPKLALGMVAGLYLAILPGVTFYQDYLPKMEFWEEPRWVMYGRVPWLVLTAAVLALVSIGRPKLRERWLATLQILAVFAFSVYSGGDWMRGYRWIALCAVPLAVLLADAVRTVALAIGPRWKLGHTGLALGLAAPVLLANVGQTIDVISMMDTSPFDVRRRVKYTQGVRDRLHIDFVRNVEVDMGGNLYWSGFEMLDLAGLCDVPIARHHYPVWFVDTYFKTEKNPNFAHIHGSWAPKTKVYKRPWFRKDYIDIPGFGQSWSQWYHQGNYIRRDLFIDPVWPQGERTMDFGRRLRLDDLRVPAPQVHAGGHLYVETGWSVRRTLNPFRAVVFLHRNGRVVSHELPPAYDWLPVNRWRTQQTIVGRYSIPLPDDLESGAWDIGIAVYGDQDVRKPVAAATPEPEPVFMRGEVRWEGVVEVTSREQVLETATIGLGYAVLAAREDDCDEADRRWASARRHVGRDDPWQEDARAAADQERARCRARIAERDLDVEAIAEARRLAPRDAQVLEIAHRLADRWQDEGDAAAEQGDDEATWAGWNRALAADPTRSWLRRKAEALRPTVHGSKNKKKTKR